MELVEGTSLAERVRDPARRTALSPKAVLLPILDALGMVHRLGVVHRDVKPGNILLAANGQPKLTDFGIARLNRAVDQIGLTQTGTMIGTPSYMAPEQARGEETDHRADLFSVGCILYEMLTGKAPFSGNNLSETILLLLGPEPARWDPIARVAPQYMNLLVRAVAKPVEERFASATEFAAALRAVDEAPAQQNPAALWDMTVVGPADDVPGSGPRPLARFDPEFLTALGSELATYLGPIASTLVRRAAEQADDPEALCRTLAGHLDKPEQRGTFLRRHVGTARQSGTMIAPPGLTATAASPADAAIGSEALVAAQLALAEQIGPIAALIVRRAAAGATGLAHFIDRVAAQVPIDSRVRQRLQEVMQASRRR
jgi:hypothetical protein